MDFQQYCRELEERRRGDSPCLVTFASTESSHGLARRIVREYCDEGSSPPSVDLVAWEQTQGQGQRDRRWISPPGAGIYATLVRELPSEQSLQTLPQAVAVVLCETLRPLLERPCKLKWPNDLLVEERKLGGILIDSVSRGAELPVAAVSFGVNVHSAPSLSELPATSLEAEARALPSMAALALDLIDAVSDAICSPLEGLGERYAELSMHRPGESLRVRLGEEVLEGTFLGFDPRGFARLEVEGAERRVSAGEVLLGSRTHGD